MISLKYPPTTAECCELDTDWTRFMIDSRLDANTERATWVVSAKVPLVYCVRTMPVHML